MDVHGAEIARMPPPIRVDHLVRVLVVVPVPAHHRITPCTYLTRNARQYRLTGCRIDNLELNVGVNGANRRYSSVQRGISIALTACRASLGHSVSNRDFGQVHPFDHPFHQLDRTGRSGHGSGTKAREIELIKAWVASYRRKADSRAALLEILSLVVASPSSSVDPAPAN